MCTCRYQLKIKKQLISINSDVIEARGKQTRLCGIVNRAI